VSLVFPVLYFLYIQAAVLCVKGKGRHVITNDQIHIYHTRISSELPSSHKEV